MWFYIALASVLLCTYYIFTIITNRNALDPLRKLGLIKPVPYREAPTALTAGIVYHRVPRSSVAHRCRYNDDRGKSPKGAIWICVCGRGYVRRGTSHEGVLEKEREYWWRIRPHHPLLYSRYRRLLTKQVRARLARAQLTSTTYDSRLAS